jgi:flagellar FliJ protein
MPSLISADHSCIWVQGANNLDSWPSNVGLRYVCPIYKIYSMPEKFTLQPLLDLMRDRTDEATRQLGQLIAAEQDAKGRLQLLSQYREEYAQRFRDAQAQGLTLQSWQNYQDFLAKIDEAIAQQGSIVVASRQNTAAGQQRWQEQHTRMKAIDTLSVRHWKAQDKKANKQEQKQLDEFAARNYRSNKEN